MFPGRRGAACSFLGLCVQLWLVFHLGVIWSLENFLFSSMDELGIQLGRQSVRVQAIRRH